MDHTWPEPPKFYDTDEARRQTDRMIEKILYRALPLCRTDAEIESITTNMTCLRSLLSEERAIAFLSELQRSEPIYTTEIA